MGGKPQGADCGKRKETTSKPQAQTPPPYMPDPAPERPCEITTVKVGANCDCNSPLSFRKDLDVGGFIRGCEASARNPSGDSFCFTYSGHTLTAMRVDSNSCWCDDSLSVRCCIVPLGFSFGAIIR